MGLWGCGVVGRAEVREGGGGGVPKPFHPTFDRQACTPHPKERGDQAEGE